MVIFGLSCENGSLQSEGNQNQSSLFIATKIRGALCCMNCKIIVLVVIVNYKE